MSTRSIEQSAQICRLLADATRVRLLLLLDEFSLSVAELTEITGLSQSRVSTHLGKLRSAGLIEDRRRGAASAYSAVSGAGASSTVWAALRSEIDHDEITSDRERAREVLRRRAAGRSWAESVAGQMELHYSPGRTWEATTHSLLPLLQLGDVLDVAAGDGVLAALLAAQARSVTCIDFSEAIVAAGRARLADYGNAGYVRGDMHALPFCSGQFDQVFLLHALTYTDEPARVLSEIRRVLRPGGQAIIATLAEHEHAATAAAFDHRNQGYSLSAMKELLHGAGLDSDNCDISLRETQPPYFELITASAQPLRT